MKEKEIPEYARDFLETLIRVRSKIQTEEDKKSFDKTVSVFFEALREEIEAQQKR